jgi:hypothetical protein
MATAEHLNGVIMGGLSLLVCVIVTLSVHGAAQDNIENCKGGLSNLDNGQSTALKAFIFITATLSFLGSSFIIFSYYYFVELRSFPLKLITMLSVSDWFSSLQFYVGIDNFANKCFEKYFACSMSATMGQFFEMASFCWTTVIAFNIYQVLVARQGERVERYEKVYHAFAWGFPMLLLVVVAATDSLGDAGNWCWIKLDHTGARWFGYYIPLLVMMMLNGYFYVKIGRGLKSFATGQKVAIVQRLRVYLAVFLVTRMPSVLNRGYELFAVDHSFFLLLLQSLSAPLQGFCNAVVYGSNKKLKDQWADFLQTRLGIGRGPPGGTNVTGDGGEFTSMGGGDGQPDAV